MAFERIFNVPGNDNVVLRLRSDGWSGKVIDASAEDQEDREFKLDMSFQISNVPNYGSGWLRTESDNYGYVVRKNSGYVCIILEWWGLYDDSGEYVMQSQGYDPNNYYNPIPAWGTDVDEYTYIRAGDIRLYHIKSLNLWSHEEEESNNVNYTVRNANNVTPTWMRYNYIADGVAHWETEIDTDLPIFETYQDAMVWIADPTDTSTMLNADEVDPEEEYKLSQLTYYVHNIFQRKYLGEKTTYWRNYRWKPGYGSKIRFYRTKPSASSPYNLVLIVPPNLTRYSAPKGQYNDDDLYEEDHDTLQTHYLDRDCLYYDDMERKDEWIVVGNDFKTNIPIFADAQASTDYANDIIGIEDALNYQDIRDYLNELPTPEFGDEDLFTETGVNGQNFGNGSCFYALTVGQMNAFFAEVFAHPDVWTSFKDGTLLFGEESIDALFGCLYLPISDLSDIASLESSAGAIFVGAWESQRAEGRKILRNDKMITCGEFQLTDMFKDVRDYEPYTQLFVQLPYCGTHQLAIQKYLNKLVTVKYAVDIFTGACTALLFANGILLDSFDGIMGMQRPITGRTAGSLISSIIGGGAMTAGAVAAGGKAIPSLSAGASALDAWGSAEAAGAYGGVYSGGTAVGAYTGGLNTVETITAGGALRANAGGLAAAGGGMAIGAGIALAGTYAAWKIKNAYDNPPMTTRGSYSSGLGFFANQKIHFIVAIKNTDRPQNELNLIGYPSGKSGKIGDFSGYLKCSTVYLTDGFIGSSQERNEILQMLAAGIYI